MKKCPACNQGGKKWRTLFVKGMLIAGACDRCLYSFDKRKDLRTTSS